MSNVTLFHDLWTDARFAVRSLLKHPGIVSS